MRHHPATRPFLALLLAAAALACGREVAEPTWPPEVEGTWTWVRSIQAQTNAVLTPAAAGYDAELRLVVDAADRAAGRYEYRRGGELVDRGRFDIAFEDEPGNDFVAWDPPFGDYHEQQWLVAWSDSLRLIDATLDGYNVLWARGGGAP